MLGDVGADVLEAAVPLNPLGITAVAARALPDLLRARPECPVQNALRERPASALIAGLAEVTSDR